MPPDAYQRLCTDEPAAPTGNYPCDKVAEVTARLSKLHADLVSIVGTLDCSNRPAFTDRVRARIAADVASTAAARVMQERSALNDLEVQLRAWLGERLESGFSAREEWPTCSTCGYPMTSVMRSPTGDFRQVAQRWNCLNNKCTVGNTCSDCGARMHPWEGPTEDGQRCTKCPAVRWPVADYERLRV